MPDSNESASNPNPWVLANSLGHLYYRRRCLQSKCLLPRLPSPPIRPREARPRSIHITSYPSGFVPLELRPPPEPSPQQLLKQQKRREKQEKAKQERDEKERKERERAEKKRRAQDEKKQQRPQTPTDPALISAINKLRATFGLDPYTRPSQTPPLVQGDLVSPAQSPIEVGNPLRRSSSTRRASNSPVNEGESMALRTIAIGDTMRPPLVSTQFGNSHRNSMVSVRSAKNAVTSLVTEIPKPVASGSGVSCSILLAEPTVFLAGFEHDGVRHDPQGGTALLRGKLRLKVSKNVKIKGVQLKLAGRARTEWPEGIPPLKVDIFEEQSLRTQVLTFFNAVNEGWETEFGNQCNYTLKASSSANSSSTNLAATLQTPSPRNSLSPAPSFLSSLSSQRGEMTARELKRLSLQSNQSRSFGKGDSGSGAMHAKGYKVFYPGTYDYSFELPIDHHQLETTKLQYGSVKWELHAIVERAGAFKPNLHGVKEVPIVRVPDQLSLEMTEPISISRQWEDQLHYDIIISGKSFPIGAKIPIAFKLTPLAKVQVHKLKVFVTESIEYWTNDRRVTRKDPGRKLLLLEKTAGKPLDPIYGASDIRILSGGELTPRQRREAREAAILRRTIEASRLNAPPRALPEPSENLLGDLDLGLESYWGSTEMEMNVQLPTCEMMAKNRDLRLHPDCSWKNVNVYHWIKIVMRISRADAEDPSKRRHFEISIDSPFTVLDCRATHANTSLPEYCLPEDYSGCSRTTTCGCPDATAINCPSDVSPTGSTGTLPTVEPTISDTALPAIPRAAHVAASGLHAGPSPAQDSPRSSMLVDPLGLIQPGLARPMHLMRVPSYNPPAFDADEPPPAVTEAEDESGPANATPVQTPPPQYDVIIGTPSVDGLADYFTRLADYGFDTPDDDSDSADEGPARIVERGGRVNVAHPRTPGVRRAPSRSLDIQRPPVNLRLDALPNMQHAGAV